LKIVGIKKDCPLFEAGVRCGDEILKINGSSPSDLLDIFIHKDEPSELIIQSNGRKRKFLAENLRGIEVDTEYKRCQNQCFFCFVDGLPRGLRKSLYFKDDDYRLSFLFGNYITMTNLRDKDLKRIGNLHLSPLYISVHATDPEVRRNLLGNNRAGMILEQLEALTTSGISFHTQIVLIPGINDGNILFKSIDDLMRFIPYLESIAIVPAGRTRFNGSRIPEIDTQYAKNLLASLDKIKSSLIHRRGYDIIQISDEFYLLAGRPLPPRRSYGHFPQIENGCGMVVKLLEEIGQATRARTSPDDLYLVTSHHPRPFLKPLIDHLTIPEERLITVDNDFFGRSVWVAGLLTAPDIEKATRSIAGRFIIPYDTAPLGLFIDGARITDHPQWIVAPPDISSLTRLVETL